MASTDQTRTSKAKRFRIAFSFAGEKREFVAQAAEILAEEFGESAILYDKYHEAEFATPDLGLLLPALYGEESDLIVIILCDEYDKKRWTGWEWNHIYGSLSREDTKRVMLCRFDRATVVGLSSAAGFVDLDEKTPEQFAALILQRLAIVENQPRDFYSARIRPPATVSAPSASTNVASDEHGPGISALNAIGLEFRRLHFVKLLHDTTASRVSVYTIDKTEYVLKRTSEDLCQFETLSHLAQQKDLTARDGPSGVAVTIGLPLAVWKGNGFVYELRRYYKGMTLEELVLRNRFRITAELAARFHNAFVEALFALHALAVVHRDIQPRNILLTPSCDFVLLDSSFACGMDLPQTPIDSIYYTAPEQLNGNAVAASDFYSLGAVEFFMANGRPPGNRTGNEYVDGLRNINFGQWYSRISPDISGEAADTLDRYSGGRFIAALLLDEAARRPSSPWNLHLITGSRAVFLLASDVRSVLDAGELGFLVCGGSDYELFGRRAINDFLAQVEEIKGGYGRQQTNHSDRLRTAIKNQLAGKPGWKV